jgi:hypothetical protein
MSIDKVYIFTILPRGKDRANMCLGGLLTLHTPSEKIEIFVGRDHEEFKTRRDICNAAADDGFPEFLKFADTDAEHAVLAQNWSYCQLFRQIQQNNEIAMWMHDDTALRFHFGRYESLTHKLKNSDANFKCLALAGEAHFLEWNDVPTHNGLLHKGLPRGAGDYCNIITPRFSEWIFDSSYLKTRRFHQYENWLSDEISGKNKVPDGFYTIPREFSSWRFNPKVSPSLIHTNKEGHAGPQRSRIE